MSIFCSKKINPPVRVCLRLKRTREEQGLNLDTLAQTTRIPKKYLLAIEDCDFTKLPKAKAYRLAYLREYAKALKLNPDDIIRQFTGEDGLEDIAAIHPQRQIKFLHLGSFTFLTRALAIAFLILLFVSYLIWQVLGVRQPPKLAIYSPLEGYVTNNLNITVQGETEKECQLTINGQEVMPNERGQFSVAVDLAFGVNTITISATQKHGKISTLSRHVVVRETKPENDNLSLK